MLAAELDAKRFELLLEALPNARKVAVLNRGNGMPFARVATSSTGGQDPALRSRTHLTWRATTSDLRLQ